MYWSFSFSISPSNEFSKLKGLTEDEIIGWVTDSMDMSLSKLQGSVIDGEAWRAAVHGSQRVRHDGATELNRCQFPTPSAPQVKPRTMVTPVQVGSVQQCQNS